MFDPSQLPIGVTSVERGRDVTKRRKTFLATVLLPFSKVCCQTASCRSLSPCFVLCWGHGTRGCDLRAEDTEDGAVGRGAAGGLRPTCCLDNTLIRLRCEWTWHCDIGEFHSPHGSSSACCINMPLMFHSDVGSVCSTSLVTNCSDKHPHIWCHY